MSKRIVPFMLVILLLASWTLSTATAQTPGEFLIVPLLPNQTFIIGSGQVGVIRMGWAACNSGLVRAWINASNYELTLLNQDGSPRLVLTPEDVDELWGPIEPVEPQPGLCSGNQRPAVARWRYVLTDLPAGEYELYYTSWVDHPLTDGADFDGDGRPDLYRPEDLYAERLHTIVVLD